MTICFLCQINWKFKFWNFFYIFIFYFYRVSGIIKFLSTVFVIDKSEIPKLSLETLTEVAASVTKRDEGSPEYVEVAKPQAASEARDANIPVRPPTTVSYQHYF